MKSLNFFGVFGLFFEEKRAKLKKLAAKHAPHSLFFPTLTESGPIQTLN